MIQHDITYQDTLELAEKEFADFIEKNKSVTKSGSIFSFAIPVKPLNHISKLNEIDTQFSDFLFYEKKGDGYSFIAIDKLRELYIKNSLDSLKNLVLNLKTNIRTNWEDIDLKNPPFITGGVKFDSNRTSEEWKDFKNYHFFIPKILLLQTANESYFIYNFTLDDDSDVSAMIDDFNLKVTTLLNAESNGKAKMNMIFENDPGVNGNKKYWYNLVSDTIQKLNLNFKKVVLSRRIELDVKDKIDWVTCFNNLAPAFPGCYLFMLKSKDAVFFGASPEKFISIRGDKIEIDALAGSAPADSKDVKTELMTKKNLKEHQYVIDFITEILRKYGNNIRIDSEPAIKKLKHVQHLHTKIYATLNSGSNVTDLIESMYPTPAVCGLPKSNAIETIRETEDFDRGLFSGLTGWIDLDMNCEFAVAIRSALYCNKKLYLYAGAGIVEESVPEKEYAETEMKFNTILKLFNEENPG